MLRIARGSLALALLTLAACGTSQDETPKQQPEPAAAETAYGSAAEVTAYVETIMPLVQRHNRLLSSYEEALASAKQGTADRRGTGRNLSEKASSVQPQLTNLLTELDDITPPALLAPFHRDTRKMVATRIESLTKTMEGWKIEQAGGEFEPVYREAEAKYADANEIVVRLNTEMGQVQAALQQVSATP